MTVALINFVAEADPIEFVSMSVYDKGLITVLISVCLMALLAVPLLLRKIPRNRVYGFRTRATLEDDSVWYEANAHFGRYLLVSCAVSMISILILYRLDLTGTFFLNASIVVLAFPPFLAILATLRFLGGTHNKGRKQ